MRPWPKGIKTNSVRWPMVPTWRVETGRAWSTGTERRADDGSPAPSAGHAENRRNTAGQADAVISVALA